MKEAEDEGKRIQLIRDRHQQVRQLFFKQARTNRLKVNFFFSSILSIDHFSPLLASRMGYSTYQ